MKVNFEKFITYRQTPYVRHRFGGNFFSSSKSYKVTPPPPQHFFGVFKIRAYKII
jgi:hypothetical protein